VSIFFRFDIPSLPSFYISLHHQQELTYCVHQSFNLSKFLVPFPMVRLSTLDMP
jgi:hypothetical protein